MQSHGLYTCPLAARLLTRKAPAAITLVRQATAMTAFDPHVLTAIHFYDANCIKPFGSFYLFACWPLLTGKEKPCR